VAPGHLELRVRVPASRGKRRVELRWAAAPKLPDGRSAAAQIVFLGFVPVGSAAVVHPPSAVNRFPDDLKPDLSYTGIYGDGWLHRQASIVLAGGAAADLLLRAEVPPAPGVQRLQLRVNGRQVAAREVAPGHLELRVRVPASRSPRRVELRWATAPKLPAPDGRPAAALLKFLGIVRDGRPAGTSAAPKPAASGAPSSISRFPADLGNAALRPVGIEPDGWVKQDARLVLAGGPATKLAIRGQALTLSNHQAQQLQLSINGKAIATEAVPPGSHLDLRIPIPVSAGDRHIRLHFGHTTAIAANDPRQATIHLTLLSVAAVTSQTSLTAMLSPEGESPRPDRVPSHAGGRFDGQLSGRRLSWRLTLHHLSSPATAAYTHLGAGSGSGPQVSKLCGPCSTTESGIVTLTPAQASDLIAGRVYVNVGTVTNPDGEVRGSIVP